MLTPWGFADQVDNIAPGLLSVSTPSHGGLLVSRELAERCLSDAAIRIGSEYGHWIAFEEDCAYAVVVFELPQLDWNKVFRTPRTALEWWEEMRKVVERWYPKYFLNVATEENRLHQR